MLSTSVASKAFLYDAAVGDASPHKIRVEFQHDVGGSLTVDDFLIDNVTTDTRLASGFQFVYDAATRVATLAYDPDNDAATLNILPDGNYRATLAKNDVDAPGHGGLASDMILDFFVLGGDMTGASSPTSPNAPRDRKVGFPDLVLFAANSNTTGKTYGTGNATHDPAGDVNFADQVRIAQNYNKVLAEPPAGPNEVALSSLEPGSVTINWLDTAIGESGWRVQMSSDGTNFGVYHDVRANQRSYTFTGLTQGAKYWFRARATSDPTRNPHGPNTAYTAKRSIVVSMAAPRVIGWAEPGTTTATLTWARHPDATGYTLSRITGATTTVIDTIAQPAGGDLTRTITRPAGATETYALAAHTAHGSSGVALVMTPAAPTAPAVTTNASGQFVLAWTNRSATATDYAVERYSLADGGTWAVVGTVGATAAPTFTDASPTVDGRRYQYRVTPLVAGSPLGFIPSASAEAIRGHAFASVAPALDTVATLAGGAEGGDPASLAYSPDTGVRYADGTLRYKAVDLVGQGLGLDWGVTRSWVGGHNATGGGDGFGDGWMIDQRPFLKKLNASGTELLLVLSGTDAIYFKETATAGVFKAQLFGAATATASFRTDVIYYNSTHAEYRLASSGGRVIRFHDFAAAPTGGKLKQIDGVGKATYDAGGRITAFQRYDLTQRYDERYAYAWGEHAGVGWRIDSIQLQRVDRNTMTVGGTEHASDDAYAVARHVGYTYYSDVNDPNGNPGDLKLVEVRDGGATAPVIDRNYYRYHRSGSGTYAGALRLAFDARSTARLMANVADYQGASDATARVYAALEVAYDADRAATRVVVQGAGSSWTDGRGVFDYAYQASTSTAAVSASRWTRKATEALPGSGARTVYTNYTGQVLLNGHDEPNGDGTRQRLTYHAYDDNGRLTLTAQPSAVSGLYEASTGSLLDDPNNAGGNLEGLRDAAGLIETHTYGTATVDATQDLISWMLAGDIEGYRKSTQLKRGETDVMPDTRHVSLYHLFGFNGGDTPIRFGVLASALTFSGEDGSGEQRTNYEYSHGWASSGHAPANFFDLTYILPPTINDSQNGDEYIDFQQQFINLDPQGRIGSTIVGGIVTRYAYDDLTGSLTRVTLDPGGKAITTRFEDLDELGRPTKVTDPNGNVTYTVYDDVNHARRVYHDVRPDGSNWVTTGPVRLEREDYARGYAERVEYAPATVDVSGGVPTGTEAIGASMTALTRSFEDVSGLATRVETYHNLAGLTYSASSHSLGSIGTHFYASQADHDAAGRVDREVNGVGTITRYAYDGVGNVLSKWVGTGDHVPTGDWSPASDHSQGYLVWDPATQANVESVTPLAGNMTRVESYDYDDPNDAIADGLGIGIGNGTVTKVTSVVGGGVADRVTHLHYDWRDRLVLTRGGVGGATNDLNRPVVRHSLDNLGRATRTERFDGDTVSSIGYAGGVPVAPADGLRRARAETAYDDLGNVFRQRTVKVDPATGGIGGSLDANYYYSTFGALLMTRAPGGLVTKHGYDSAGRPAITYVTDGGGDQPHWYYAADLYADRVLEQTQYTLDQNGNVTFKLVKQASHVSTATGHYYDLPARPSTPTTHTPGEAPRTYNYAFQYDAADRLTRSVDIGANDGYFYPHGSGWTIPTRSTDSGALVTDHAYDAAGHLASTTDPRGIVDKTTHDALGRVTATIEAYTDGVPGAADDRTTRYAHDANGNVTLLTAVLPGTGQFQKTAYRYGVSAVGADASGLFTNDLLARVEYPNLISGEPEPALAERTTYDAAGQPVTATDRRGTVHAYAYDPLGRLATDAATSLGAGVDGGVRRLAYGYDALGNASRFDSFAAVSGGTPVNSVERTYDSLNRVTKERQTMGSLSGDVLFGYDDADANADGVLDVGGRLTSMTYPNGRVLTYGYDAGVDTAIGRLSHLDDDTSAGVLERLSYLGLSTPVVRAHPEARTDWSLAMRHTAGGWEDPDGTPTTERNDGDLYTGLDNHGRVARVRWDATDAGGFHEGTAREDLAYGYDANGNRLYRRNHLNHSFDELYHADGATAGYDALDRLVEMQRGPLSDADADGTPDTVAAETRTQAWDLDALGNWTNLTGATGGGSFDQDQGHAHDKQNGIKTIAYGPGGGAVGGGYVVTLTHSPNGEMTTDDRGQTYAYNAWGQLTLVDPDGAGPLAATVYTYDALFRRISEDADGAAAAVPTTHLYYAPSWQLIEERVVTGAGTERLSAQHVQSPVYVDAFVLSDVDRDADGVLNEPGERVYILQDGNYNVTALVADTDLMAGGWQPGVIERYAYDAYGSATVLDANWQADADGHSDVGNRYLFQGGRHDASLQTSHFRFRDLHVDLGRWTRQDPYDYVDGYNLAQHTRSNPIRFVDPSGLVAPLILAGAAFGIWLFSSGCDEEEKDAATDLGTAAAAEAGGEGTGLANDGREALNAVAEVGKLGAGIMRQQRELKLTTEKSTRGFDEDPLWRALKKIEDNNRASDDEKKPDPGLTDEEKQALRDDLRDRGINSTLGE